MDRFREMRRQDSLNVRERRAETRSDLIACLPDQRQGQPGSATGLDEVLTAAAEADLRDVIRYTRREWGDAQTRSYLAKLTRGIERIASGQGTSKDMAALYPGCGWSIASITISSACRATMRPPLSWRFSMSEWI